VTRWRELGGRPHGETGVSSAAFWLYAGHLAALVALALSNVLLALAALVSPWREVRRRLPVARDLLITIGVYLLLLGGSIAASYDPAVSLGAASDLFNFLVPIVALLVVRDTRRARLLIRILIVVGTLIAGMALYQYSLAANHLEQRATGPFSHYMTLGSFLVLVDCFLVAWMAFGGGWRRWWSWVCFLLIQAALLVSYTRNAWIALALVLVLVTAVRAPRLLALWAPVVLLVVLLAPSSLLARFGSIFDLTDQSNYDRLCMGYAGLHMIVDKPVFGQGPGMVSERYPIYRHPTAPRQEVPHLHNSFLNLAAERGVASLATLLALLALPAARAVRSLRSARRQGAGAAADVLVATLLVVLTTLVTGLFEDYWSDTEIQRLVLFALALPYCLAAERSADGEPVEAS
jgi:O-antigen ligase